MKVLAKLAGRPAQNKPLKKSRRELRWFSQLGFVNDWTIYLHGQIIPPFFRDDALPSRNNFRTPRPELRRSATASSRRDARSPAGRRGASVFAGAEFSPRLDCQTCRACRW